MKKSNNITDIIAGCRKGHSIYQRALVDNYSELLYSVCLRYMRDETKARDALQETFIRIFKSFHTFDSNKGALTAWMRKIAVNVALRSLSKKKLEVSNLSFEITDRISVDPEIMHKLHHDELMTIVQSLPDGYRQVFNLSVIEGFSHKEIGHMLGIAEVSSRSNLSRAKQQLRQKLQALKSLDSCNKAI